MLKNNKRTKNQKKKRNIKGQPGKILTGGSLGNPRKAEVNRGTRRERKRSRGGLNLINKTTRNKEHIETTKLAS